MVEMHEKSCDAVAFDGLICTVSKLGWRQEAR